MGTHFEHFDTTLSFGYRGRLRRRALDLTQKELARRAWCSVATIKQIEADRRPSRPLAKTLAEYMYVADGERETFLQAARGNRAPDALTLSRKPQRAVTPLTFATEHPLLREAFTLGEPERVRRAADNIVSASETGGEG